MNAIIGQLFQVAILKTLILLFAGGIAADEFHGGEDFSQLNVSQLEKQLADIDNELKSLARLSLRNEVGAIGHRSEWHNSAEATEWIQIDFGDPVSIDEVVLVPALWRDTDEGFRADGFPVEFQIIIGTSNDGASAHESGTVIASFTADDRLLPRVAPVIVPCENVTATWLRVEATRLSQKGFNSRFVFQLSEILVFNGLENVALNKPVRTSSETGVGGARHARFLVDGDVPYLMNSSDGQQSLPFIGVGEPDESTFLTIDLLESQPINCIQLHGIDISDTAPRSTTVDYGVPRHLVVEGANHEDFSDQITLCEFRVRSEYDVAPIVTRQFEEMKCRYVRLRVIEPYLFTNKGVETTRLGYSEIEVFSAGCNVALEMPVVATHAKLDPNRPVAALTDGHNLYGNVLSIREWLGELARRHDLEAARPVLNAELNTRFNEQKSMLRATQFLAGLLITALALTFVISNRIRKQKIAALRKRFAADLHDELGANLHTISLLSEFAQQAPPSSEEFKSLHARIGAMTTRSANTIRQWASVEQTDEFCTDLVSDMRRAAERIIVRLKHDFQVEGHEHLDRLNSQTRADILLFYKECLINICRHAEATHLHTDLNVNANAIHLAVLDNGRGITDAGNDDIPASLQRRAQLLGADVTVECPAEGGTGIRLTLPIRRRRHH